jgi:hypothetical protein
LVTSTGSFAAFAGTGLKLATNFPNLTVAVSGTLTDLGRFR